jgi:hypothetical protein
MLANQFENPYLRSLFTFVIHNDAAIQSILVILKLNRALLDFSDGILIILPFVKDDEELMFEDRVSLAVHFLSTKPNELRELFNKLLRKSIETVNIKGILLTGLSASCVQLFNSFNQKTNDVQTIALAIVHSTFPDVLYDPVVRGWIEW